MSQWLRRKIISFMGNVYVWLDKGLEHETSPILGMHIDYDLQEMSRRELCRHIEKKFGWEEDSFWNLESTQKIRLCCQKARQMQYINAPPKLDEQAFKKRGRK
jgi:hypothetical protein